MSILWLVVLCLIQAEVQVFKMVSKAPYLHLLFLISVSTYHNFSLWSLNSSPTTLNPLTVWITTVEDSSRYGNTRSPDPPFRNLYTGQEATVRTGHGTTNLFQIRKGVHQGCILSSCLFNLYAITSWEMLGWMKHKLSIKELMLLNCGVGEYSWESLGLQGDQTS